MMEVKEASIPTLITINILWLEHFSNVTYIK